MCLSLFVSCAPKQPVKAELDLSEYAQSQTQKGNLEVKKSQDLVQDRVGMDAKNWPGFSEKSFKAYVLEAMRITRTPGVVLAVVKNGELVLSRAYGHEDIEKTRVLDLESDLRFSLEGMSEALAGYVISALVQARLLSWEMAVSEVVPGFKYGDVTLGHVLTGTSGLSGSGVAKFFDVSAGNIMKQAARLERMHAPGTVYAPNDLLLSAVMYGIAYKVMGGDLGNVEQVDWQSNYDRLMAKYGPLKLDQTVGAVSEKAVMGHDVDFEFRLKPLKARRGVSGTLSEVTAWVRAELLSSSKGNFELRNLGYQQKPVMSGVNLYRAGGVRNGISSAVGIIPELNFGYVVLANARGGDRVDLLIERQILDIELNQHASEVMLGEVKEVLEQMRASRQRFFSQVEMRPEESWLDLILGDYRHAWLGEIRLVVRDGVGILQTQHWESRVGRISYPNGDTGIVLLDPPLSAMVLHPWMDGGEVRGVTMSDVGMDYRFERVLLP